MKVNTNKIKVIEQEKEVNKTNQVKREDKNGWPDPIEVQCFQCQKQFWVKWVVPQANYSKKSRWDYWTNKEEDKGKFIDNLCLRNYYLDKEKRKEFLKIIDPKRKSNFRSYLARNII